MTREPHQPFAVLRRERFVWAARPEHGAWLREPLPVALFEPGDIARRYAENIVRRMWPALYVKAVEAAPALTPD